MVERPDIGRRIRDARQKNRLSQSEVVDRLMEYGISMSRETLSKIENNNRSVSAIELNALCNIFDVDMNEIFAKEPKEEDLVTFFRKKNASENTLIEIARLQDMIRTFIKHEKMYMEGLNS
ncbi:MAG TPA: helix-turn-helix transcriptional regulator [Tepidimicrobium sp.]|nr:helix-turn-helix transcriptional regulator [Tepidimicrobium sp.]